MRISIGDEMKNKKIKMPTMNDIAKLAGVSQSTVSLVLNNKRIDNISEVTRERIYQARESLGYRPNKLASALNGKSSGVIGFITDELVTTNFAGIIVKGAQDTAWNKHKVLMLVNLDDRAGMVEEAIDMMVSYRVESVMFAAMYHHEIILPKNLDIIPTVLINCYDKLNSVPCVVPDEFQGAYEAVAYLIKNNHRNIAYISNKKKIPATLLREEGYKKALADYKIGESEYHIIQTDLNGESVYKETIKLLSGGNRPTAIMCYNDRCAIAVYSAAATMNLKIPEDLSVIGYDNQTVISEFIIPSLTTMQLPHYEMGEWATNYILNNKYPFNPIKEKIKPDLIIRDSVKEIRK